MQLDLNLSLEDIPSLEDLIVSEAVERHNTQEQKGGLDALLKVLESIGPNGRALIPRIMEEAANRGVVAAVPTAEPVNLRTSANLSNALPVVGIDGSQIYPNDVEPIWAYVRAVAYATESERTEQAGRFLGYHQLVNKDGYLLKNATDARRDALEMGLLSQVVADPDWSGGVFLLDGSLLPWAIGKELEQSAAEHRNHLLKARGALVASVVSQPKSNYLLNLIRIKIGESRGAIHDWVLAGKMLDDGERSAVFVHGSPQNKELPGHAEIHMFYLRVGEEVLRVEIPAWVACDLAAVEYVHASILNDCLDGYPFALMGAHDRAKIRADVAEQLKENMAAAFAERTGRYPALSMKERFKEL